MEFSNFDTWLDFLALNSDQTSRLWLESDFRTQSCYQNLIDMSSSSQMLTLDRNFRFWLEINLPNLEVWTIFRTLKSDQISKRCWDVINLSVFNLWSNFQTLICTLNSETLTFDQTSRPWHLIKLPDFDVRSNSQTLVCDQTYRLCMCLNFQTLTCDQISRLR